MNADVYRIVYICIPTHMFIQHHQFLKHARLPKTVAHFQGPHLQMDEKIARLPKQQLQVPPQSTSNRE